MGLLGFIHLWMARCKGSRNHAFISCVRLFQGDARVPKMVPALPPYLSFQTPIQFLLSWKAASKRGETGRDPECNQVRLRSTGGVFLSQTTIQIVNQTMV